MDDKKENTTNQTDDADVQNLDDTGGGESEIETVDVENASVAEEPTAIQPDESTLTADQQQFVLQLLLRGASPAGACGQLGVSVFAFFRTCDREQGFRRSVEHVYTVLSQNVLSVLYRLAMEGNVSAQSFWLKGHPPPGWQAEPSAPDEPRTFDDFFDQLTDHELLELARAMGVDLPPEIERTLFGPGGGEFAGGVPS